MCFLCRVLTFYQLLKLLHANTSKCISGERDVCWDLMFILQCLGAQDSTSGAHLKSYLSKAARWRLCCWTWSSRMQPLSTLSSSLHEYE